MIKILICLFSGIAIALFMLNLRHQQLELRHQNPELHDKIKSQQARLWTQQLQIAVYTGPSCPSVKPSRASSSRWFRSSRSSIRIGPSHRPMGINRGPRDDPRGKPSAAPAPSRYRFTTEAQKHGGVLEFEYIGVMYCCL